MTLAIDVDRVTHVLLADGWHEVTDESFTVGPYEFGQTVSTATGEREFVVLPGADSLGVSPVGFAFTEARTGSLMSGPLTSVFAVRQERK
jgi:hypothetical protein